MFREIMKIPIHHGTSLRYMQNNRDKENGFQTHLGSENNRSHIKGQTPGQHHVSRKTDSPFKTLEKSFSTQNSILSQTIKHE